MTVELWCSTRAVCSARRALRSLVWALASVTQIPNYCAGETSAAGSTLTCQFLCFLLRCLVALLAVDIAPLWSCVTIRCKNQNQVVVPSSLRLPPIVLPFLVVLCLRSPCSSLPSFLCGTPTISLPPHFSHAQVLALSHSHSLSLSLARSIDRSRVLSKCSRRPQMRNHTSDRPTTPPTKITETIPRQPLLPFEVEYHWNRYLAHHTIKILRVHIWWCGVV